MHDREIVFDRWGLVDPTSLLEYTIRDKCLEVEPPQLPGSCKLEYHHLLFTRKAFKNHKVPLVLKRLRGSRYNQFQMLSCQEDLYHQQYANEVPQEEINISAGERFLEETELLNNYVAASWGLGLAQQRLERANGSLTRAQRAQLPASLALHHETNDSALERINDIEVIAFSVVTGALQGYLSRQPEPLMADLVTRRLAEEPASLTTKLYSESYIQHISEVKMRRKIEALNWTTRKLFEAAEAA